jgi:hypothetical protein
MERIKKKGPFWPERDYLLDLERVPIPLNPAGYSDPKRPLVPIETGHLFVGAKRRWVDKFFT